jgi:hypothetical protein
MSEPKDDPLKVVKNLVKSEISEPFQRADRSTAADVLRLGNGSRNW